jgi:predicted ATP-grasp superfamily ATP-dependent carboligase
VAHKLGLPVPQTFVPASLAEARTLLDGLSYPVFVKPVNRADWDQLPPGAVESVKGQRFDSADGLRRLLDALEVLERRDGRDGSRFVIQTFVEGGDHEHMSVHAYVLPDGTIAGTFTGSKLRIYPPRAGVGAQVLSLRMAEPEALARHILGALGYTGFAILQFKRDARRGVYELLEINCRYSTWTELPSRAGCNFPLAAYASLVGQPLPRLEQREGISWLDVERDLRGMTTYRASGEWTWGAYLRSLATVRCWAYFAWDDPAPFFRKVRNR